jgi:hypothetical protein
LGSKESMCRDDSRAEKTARMTLCPGDHANPGPVSVRAWIGWAREDAKGLSMSIKLTDAQRVMLSAAGQRDDRCLVPAPKLKGAAAQKIAGKLIAAGLVKEIKAKTKVSVWRRDDEAGISYGLTLTLAGAKAIAIDESGVPLHVGDQGDSGEDVEQTNPSSQLEHSASQEPGFSPEIPVIACRRLQHLQRPKSSHLSQTHRELRAVAMDTWRTAVAAA